MSRVASLEAELHNKNASIAARRLSFSEDSSSPPPEEAEGRQPSKLGRQHAAGGRTGRMICKERFSAESIGSASSSVTPHSAPTRRTTPPSTPQRSVNPSHRAVSSPHWSDTVLSYALASAVNDLNADASPVAHSIPGDPKPASAESRSPTSMSGLLTSAEKPRRERSVSSSSSCSSLRSTSRNLSASSAPSEVSIARALHYRQQGSASYRSASPRFGSAAEHLMAGASPLSNPPLGAKQAHATARHGPGMYEVARDVRGNLLTVAARSQAYCYLPATAPA